MGPAYGALSDGPLPAPTRPELPNGVPTQPVRAEEGARQERAIGAVSGDAGMGSRVGQRTHEGTMAGAGGATAERPFLSPESTQGTALETGLNRPPGGSPPEPELSRDSTRTLDVEVTYGAGGDQGPAVVRWVARLTDFLRTTATGAGGLQDRVLEGLGMTATQGTPSLQQTLTSPQQHPPHPVPQQQLMLPQQQPQGQFTPQRIQQLSPSARRNLVQALNFSPPEELPGTSRTMRCNV